MGLLSTKARRAAFALLSAGIINLLAACSGDVSPSSVEEDVGAQSQALTAAAWQPNKAYAVNTVVSYQGKLYRCSQAHTSAVGWEPPNVPALWAFEGLDTGSNVNTGPSGPLGALTFDYVTLQADCDSFPQTCCAAGASKTVLTDGSDVKTFSTSDNCVVSLAGADTITLTSSGNKSSINMGAGNDTAMDGPGDNFIWGGAGDDTINGYGGTNLFFGGWGNDTLNAANGKNTVVPGPGNDTVALGTGDDSVYIFDLCEVESGERLDGGTGFDTLYTPVPLADLRARGVIVSNFEKIVVEDNHCRSQCTSHIGCSYCANDDDHDGTFNCLDECPLDPAKVTPGVCNCGVSEADSDNDKVPNCVDDCPLDASTAYRGQCQCPSAPAANGTACNDGVTPGNLTCNAGVCGDPSTSAPQAGCTLKTLGTHYYWFCPAATESVATTRCAAVKGRYLAELDNRNENAFAAKLVSAESWIGAVDRTTEGEWSWLDAGGQERKKFWTGAGAGKAFKGQFNNWSGKNPGSDGAKDCGTLSADGAWRAQNCADSRPYVCEGVFGWSRIPGGGSGGHQQVGPSGIIPGWVTSSNGNDDGKDPNTDCENEPSRATLDAQKALLKTCADHCGEQLPESARATPEECETTWCKDAAAVPPATSSCGGNAEPLSQVFLPSDGIGKCTVLNQDCSGFKYLGFIPTHCGTQMRCLDVTRRGPGDWVARTCAEGCRAGTTCDPAIGKCVNPQFTSACHPDTQDNGQCFGQCYSQIGCGIGSNGLNDAASARCSETNVCSPPYTGGLNPGSNLLDPAPFDDTKFPDLTAEAAPAYSGDFNAPVLGSGTPCPGAPGDDPACRSTRHSWCNYDQTTVGAPDASLKDQKAGDRGTTSSVIKFDVDPQADLDFVVKPLPFGVSDFNVAATAGIRAGASFNLGPIRGSVELIDIRGVLAASLCRVATDDSHVELLGLDFLPALKEAAGSAGNAIFDTKKQFPDATASCEKAVNAYVDAVDRAKKAMRDAQELVKQFNELKANKHTFDSAFCNAVASADLRPPGMKGSCATETPAQTVNQFINYYADQVGKIDGALKTLTDKVLNSDQLSSLLGMTRDQGFPFFAKVGDIGGKQTATILEMTFFIGPVPCNLEVTSFLNYGIRGGFGADLRPAALLSGSGPFAKAGAIITPYADAGVTLFVGAGFSAGPFSLKLGIEGSVTLGNLELPATAVAGLSLTSDTDDRGLPSDIQGITNGESLFPHGGPRKFNFQFDYSYGVGFTVKDMLSGHIDAALKIKFFFFSKRWAKRIVSFDSGLQIGPINLIGGGNFDPTTQQHAQQVPEDTKTWKSSYASVPFMGINPVSMPDAPFTSDASFNASRAQKLYYDSLCTCDKSGDPCDRQADCCDSSEICSDQPYQVCHQEPGDCPPSTGGTLNLCPPKDVCVPHNPTTKICRPVIDGGPDTPPVF